MHTLAYTHQPNPLHSWASTLGLYTKGLSVGVQRRWTRAHSNERTTTF